jgi:hypothetical protein
MIRFSVIKLAQRLGTRGQIAGVEAVEGKVDWGSLESWEETLTGSFFHQQDQRRSGSSLNDLADSKDSEVD